MAGEPEPVGEAEATRFSHHEGLGNGVGMDCEHALAARTQQSVVMSLRFSSLRAVVPDRFCASLLWPRNTANYRIGVGWRTHLFDFGVLLGASLWYVARRLYGNVGGTLPDALLLLAGIVRSSALWFAEPEIGATWGAFGAIFTAIAVAHTLYAPREVVL